ncbi:hypothetical protein EBN03_02855 [Nocardia stercoris]|uniref:Uncharacterized protein n=1 Tax=Nocardia stercoris TaxID=2483361 RepID=A0A3M2LGZ1_9NOCA|nr:hypothetical protein EBN03_02855 [Nocardia stercoris]
MPVAGELVARQEHRQAAVGCTANRAVRVGSLDGDAFGTSEHVLTQAVRPASIARTRSLLRQQVA